MDSFKECLQASYRVNWTIADVIDGRSFDANRPWLPPRLSGARHIDCLDDEQKLGLTHVEMGSYAHLFSVVEEFIAPKMTSLAHEHALGNREAYDALTNFAAEEVKHMNLFRVVRAMIDDALGFELALFDDQERVARFVLSKSTGAVLLLTSIIEWFTQFHYVSAFKDDYAVDSLTRRIFKRHWQEESQHAKIDHLETLRAFASLPAEGRALAVDELIELLHAVDELLRSQAEMDVDNLSRHLDRPFDDADREEILAGVLRAKRYTFIECGLTHPNFQRLYTAVTTAEQREKLAGKLAPVLGAAVG